MSQARMVTFTIKEFGKRCQTEIMHSFLVPETTVAAARWHALFDFRNVGIDELKEAIQWCDVYEQDPSIPRTPSMLAHSLLSSKVAMIFLNKLSLIHI